MNRPSIWRELLTPKAIGEGLLFSALMLVIAYGFALGTPWGDVDPENNGMSPDPDFPKS